MSLETNDILSLKNNPLVNKMLAKVQCEGDEIKFSDFVTKINRKDKEQTRVLLITDKHIYNLMPNNYGKMRRQIALKEVLAISSSTQCDEFVVHVPEEYDYRFKSSRKDVIIDVIKSLTKISVKELDKSDLKEETVTKPQARLMEREAILRRKRDLGLKKEESDDDDKKEVGAGGAEWLSGFKGVQGKVQIDDFELLKVIGRGAFGKVMLVKKKDDGKIYAMKIMKKRTIIARGQVDHTKAERKILQSLDHPFLMALRYAFQSKEKLYLVLDYIKGGELFFHLKNNRRFVEEVARLWCGEVALAMGHLHSLGVIYRDLKPENILVDNTGHVVLTDFGLAKDVSPDEKN